MNVLPRRSYLSSSVTVEVISSPGRIGRYGNSSAFAYGVWYSDFSSGEAYPRACITSLRRSGEHLNAKPGGATMPPNGPAFAASASR
jgi:hypothetical protein